MSKRPAGEEAGHQAAVVHYADYMANQDPRWALLFHIPNGGKRSISEAVRFKAMGVRAGIPDLFLPVPNSAWHGLFIEMKAGKGVQTENQKRWFEKLTEQGFCCVIATSAEQAIGFIRAHLCLK